MINSVKIKGNSYDAFIDGVEWYGIDESSRFYPQIKEWLDAGNTAEPEFTLDDVKKIKIQHLYEACGSHIVGGFASDALGTVHTYPSTATDQTNLNGVVTESLVNEADVNWTAPFWCADAADVWDRRIHTHAQIQQVGQAAAVHVRDAQDKLKLLVDQVNDQTTDTIEKVDVINF